MSLIYTTFTFGNQQRTHFSVSLHSDNVCEIMCFQALMTKFAERMMECCECQYRELPRIVVNGECTEYTTVCRRCGDVRATAITDEDRASFRKQIMAMSDDMDEELKRRRAELQSLVLNGGTRADDAEELLDFEGDDADGLWDNDPARTRIDR